MAIATKQCGRCGQTKDAECFHRDRSTRDGRYGWCKACRNVPPKPPIELTISPLNLAWLAGLLEGEGTFGARKNYRPEVERTYLLPTVRLAMTDRDVVERAWRVVGLGTFIGPYLWRGHKPGHLPTWIWTVGRASEAIRLMELLLPWMGERRQRQITMAIAAWRERHPHAS